MAVTLTKTSFRGGVHPPENKDLTENLSIEALPRPKKIILPLSQHIGAPSSPSVNIGDIVKTGQSVGNASGFVSVPVHSSIAGKVTAIGRFPVPTGFLADSIVIESAEDGENEPCSPIENPMSAEPEKLKQAVLSAGIVGLGGAAFPTHVKLSPPKNKIIDTLIINGCECEPYLNCDNRLMIEQADKIIGGITVLKRILGVAQVIIGIEDNKKEAAESMQRASVSDSKIIVTLVKTKYPQGGEKQLIKTLTGKEVPPPPGLPMDAGVIVHNVATCVAVMEAVFLGKPYYERVLTVSGSGIGQPKNLLVKNGTLLNEIIEFCGGLNGCHKIIMGGPMMGLALTDINVPTLKSTSGILFLSKEEAKTFEASACLRCASCVKICPIILRPCELVNKAEAKQWDAFESDNGLECIECGSCAYSCPARIPIVQYLRIGKAEVNARKRRTA
jgi:electron transport complex protein RnfC